MDPAEVAYIDVQQGTRCERCGANVRSQALARALMHVTGGHGPLELWLQQAVARERRILEINEAGALSPWLSRLPGHVIARYPECDMMRLPYPAGAFDLVVHSDTLEHVSDPGLALGECCRVLAVGGSAVFTVPVSRRPADTKPARTAGKLSRQQGLSRFRLSGTHGVWRRRVDNSLDGRIPQLPVHRVSVPVGACAHRPAVSAAHATPMSAFAACGRGTQSPQPSPPVKVG